MDTEVDLTTVDRAVLIAIIAQLQATVLEQQRVIERLERRIAELEGQVKPGGPPRMPGLKAKSGGQPPVKQQPRKQRRHGFARRRMTPTQRVEHVRVEHVMENGPDCGTHLTGGWTQRTREVIDLPQVPAQVTEHVYLARTCPKCRRHCLPPARQEGVALGRQRLGVNGRQPDCRAAGSGQAALPYHPVVPGRGAWSAPQRGRHRGRHTKGGRPSPGDDDRHRGTDPRQSGGPRRRDRLAGGRTQRLRVDLSTPTQRYFLRRGRGKTVVDEVLGDEFAGVLVSDFYAAYHHYDGPKQRCWAHLLRDIHDRRVLYPDDLPLVQWAEAVHQLYQQAKAFTHPAEQQRRAAQLALERRLLALCRPYRDDPASAQARLCRRISNHIKELFVFVAHPEVPPDNNAAERSLRPVVISRKISGGTRSERGTETKMALASIFGTWRTQDLNPLAACQQLLASPQL